MAKEKPKTHNMLPKEMRALHEQQVSDAEPDTIPANGHDAGDYRVKKHEAHFVHVELEAKTFNSSTGVKESTPSVQMFSVRAYEAAKLNNGFAGYTTKVLHSPALAKEKLGEAVEGTRVVDGNYAAMQDKYEALTKTRPPSDWTPAMLDSAIIAAEHLTNLLAGQSNAPAPIDESKAPAHTEPSVATPDNAAPELDKGEDVKDAAAKAALAVGNATPPALDGNTNGGEAGRGETKDADKGEDGDKSKDADDANKDGDKGEDGKDADKPKDSRKDTGTPDGATKPAGRRGAAVKP